RGDLCIGFVPRDLGPSSRGASDRASEPLGIVMELLEPVRLRADEAARERIMRVAAHGHDGLALYLEREAARRFAKRTHTVDGPPVTHAETPLPQRSVARTDRTSVVMRLTLGVDRERGNYLAGNGSSCWARVGRGDQHLSIRRYHLGHQVLHLLGLVEQWVEQDQLSACRTIGTCAANCAVVDDPAPKNPSPCLTARRNASGWLAPNQIGGWGFWNGLGLPPATSNTHATRAEI